MPSLWLMVMEVFQCHEQPVNLCWESVADGGPSSQNSLSSFGFFQDCVYTTDVRWIVHCCRQRKTESIGKKGRYSSAHCREVPAGISQSLTTSTLVPDCFQTDRMQPKMWGAKRRILTHKAEIYQFQHILMLCQIFTCMSRAYADKWSTAWRKWIQNRECNPVDSNSAHPNYVKTSEWQFLL